jgi:hypothetical protein
MSDTNASVKALRALLRNRGYPLEELGSHFKKFTDRVLDDRLLGIVCSAAVEEALQGLLEANMPNGSGRLFDIQQPLCTFSAKIAAAYSFDLIDNDIRRNADYMREIRNAFAHRIAPIDFKTKEIVAVCELLKIGSRVAAEIPDVNTHMKSRYFWAAFTTIGAVANAASSEETPASLR